MVYNTVVDFETVDHLIQGKMVACVLNVNEDQFMYDKDLIRMKMASDMAQFMIDNKLIEFTQQKNYSDLSLTIRARAFVTPDNMVKIIRTLKR